MQERRAVLIIDDDAGIREALAALLSDAGYHVRCAGDGAQGLAILASRRQPMVVLLDLMMPVMDGFEVCRRLAADAALRRDHAIVLMSAHHRLATQNCPVVEAVIRKPFDIEALLTLMERLTTARHICDRGSN